jgi:hypothetical protein
MGARFAALMVALVACGEVPVVAPAVADDVWVAPPAAAEPDPLRAEIDRAMAELAAVRGLPIKRPVAGKPLGRDAVVALISAKAERDMPKAVLEAQGHLLRALGLTDADYDFVGGVYEMLEKNVAGFYDQDSETMYLLDDLPLAGARETLVHELQHAIQDQHFDLKTMLKYRPGDTDRVAAAHALCEGDATSAMFEVSQGSAFMISDRALRMAMIASVALTEGAETPRVLQASLVAAYVDGFALVQQLRRRGGWQAVDAVFRRLPDSTEQLLHLDKYDAREPAIAVPDLPLPDAGWTRVDADVLGEQGLRMVLEQWGLSDAAAAAAAGWGGDRYVVAERGSEIAVAWHIRFDDVNEAEQAARFIAKKHPACVERGDVGPFAHKRVGDAIAIAAGPFDAKSLTSRGNCGKAQAWVDAILATR